MDTLPVRIKTALVKAYRKLAQDEKRTVQGQIELALEKDLKARGILTKP